MRIYDVSFDDGSKKSTFFASTVLPFDQFSPFGSVSKLFLTEKEEEEKKKKQYATLEISNFSPGGHHQVRLSIRGACHCSL